MPISELPNDEAVAQLALANASMGTVRTETLRAFTKSYRPLVLLGALDPLQYWVTTWNDVTRRRWRRAVLIEQTAIAARRGESPRQLPRGA